MLYVLADGGYLYALAHPVPGDARARPAHDRRAGRRLPRSEAGVAAVSQKARRPGADAAYWAARLRSALDPRDGRIFERSIGGLRVLDFAEDEARRLGGARVGTEHVLLGVLKFGYRNAHILSLLGVSLEATRQAVMGHRGGLLREAPHCLIRPRPLACPPQRRRRPIGRSRLGRRRSSATP